jgi:hypothetical protein
MAAVVNFVPAPRIEALFVVASTSLFGWSKQLETSKD